MTKLLGELFEAAGKLPEALQDQLALELLEELKDEYRWNAALAGSQQELDALAEKAEQEYRTGKTREAGFDQI